MAGQHSSDYSGGLLAAAIEQFDHLLARESLFYGPSDGILFQDQGYNFEVRIIPAFNRKPILSAEDPGRKKAGGPLSDPEEEFIVAEINSTHLLQLNKFCIYRPQFILHPKEFAKQTEDLDVADFAAAWATLNQLGGKYIIFYNCGVDAGSSQGHKHLQIIPKPPHDKFKMFPDTSEMQSAFQSASSSEAKQQFSEPMAPPESLNVPFACRLLEIPEKASGAAVLARYVRLIDWLRQHEDVIGPKPAYNIVLTRDWICAIPRRKAGIEDINTNAMGMMGLVWVKDEAERAGWERQGWTRHLTTVGRYPG